MDKPDRSTATTSTDSTVSTEGVSGDGVVQPNGNPRSFVVKSRDDDAPIYMAALPRQNYSGKSPRIYRNQASAVAYVSFLDQQSMFCSNIDRKL